MLDLVKKITFAGIILFFAIEYGQNIFEYGSDLRKDFYFIGMSLNRLTFAYVFYKLYNHKLTFFWLWYCVGSVLNELLFKGGLTFFEISIGVFALIYNIVIMKNESFE